MATDFVVEEVAENLEEAAAAVRLLNTKSLAFLAAGLAIGAGVGFFLGQRWRREEIEKRAFAESEEQISKIRLYYEQQAREKAPLEEIIEERGYVAESGRPLRPPVPVSPAIPLAPVEPSVRDITHGRTEEAEKDKHDGWSYPYEMSQRNFQEPHIIHQDEYATNETEYIQTSYTYYEGDDVLTDTDDTVLENRELLIGRQALQKFGHGSDDMNIVYVRNPQLELEMEILRHSGRYEVEILGLDDSDDGTETSES